MPVLIRESLVRQVRISASSSNRQNPLIMVTRLHHAGYLQDICKNLMHVALNLRFQVRTLMTAAESSPDFPEPHPTAAEPPEPERSPA